MKTVYVVVKISAKNEIEGVFTNRDKAIAYATLLNKKYGCHYKISATDQLD